MITEEIFKETIEDYLKYDKLVEKMGDILNLPFFESGLCNFGYVMATTLFNLTFDRVGFDYIFWWLCEKQHNPELKIYKDDIELPSETIDDLWNLVKDHRSSDK